MKKVIYLLAGLFLTTTAMQAQDKPGSIPVKAQDRPMPKPGPAPTVNVGKPQTFTLKNGLKVLVVENNKLPRVSYTLTMDNAPYYEGEKKGVSDMLSALMGSGTKKMSKEAFNEETDFLGASVYFWSSGGAANGLSKYSERVMELLADGALNPVFTQEELDKAKAQMLEGLKADEKNVASVASRVTNALTYGKKHYNGEFITEETINNITLQDVKDNYDTYYVPGNAYLVVVGDVKFKDVKKQVEKLFGSWKAEKAPNVTYSNPKDVQYTQINFIDMPNAVQSEISVVNIVNLKKNDPDYFAALLANQILGGGGEGRLFLNLREAHGWTYGAYSSIGSGKYVTDFTSSTSVRNAVTDSAIVEILNELRKIRTDLVSEDDLKVAKAKYIGNFVMQMEKPSTVAQYALTTETQNLPDDFYENFIKNINAVTPEDVRNAAKKYFLSENARIVVVGKAADVLPGLERTKLPIFYFDRFGNPTEKPVLNKPVPAGVTAKTVFDNYIKAVGGEKAVKGVKSVFTTAKASVQGMELTMVSKASSNNKMLMELTGMGQTLAKNVFDGSKGYESAQGQKQELDAEKIADMKYYAQPFPELALASKPGVVLSGIEKINDKEAYVVKDDKKTLYYDTATGLKLAESIAIEEQGQSFVQTTAFSDYRDVKGVKIPYKTVMNVGIDIELTTTDAKVNEGVSDADFQ